MWVISPKPIRAFVRKHPTADGPMKEWLSKAQNADWRSIADVHRDFPAADAVPMRSGETATIFNVGGNNFRIACSIVYPGHQVYVRRVMTHKEYDTNVWHNDF